MMIVTYLTQHSLFISWNPNNDSNILFLFLKLCLKSKEIVYYFFMIKIIRQKMAY